MNLRQQVAQRFIVGYEGLQPGEVTERLFREGLGGVIFFRANFDCPGPGVGFHEPLAVAHLLATIASQIPEGLPLPFLAIDQEGGPVERLPHTLFPSAISPRAVALAHTYAANPQSDEFAQEVYDLTAYHLNLLGFNMNCFPTLDVDLNPDNPVIGIRAFSDDPAVVWRFAKIAMDRLAARNIAAVGKHFPGHGNGSVDSHHDLPVLTFTETELMPFQQAIAASIPAMMVAHGWYPALQQGHDAEGTPASLSKTVIQGLLRERLGYTGLVMTDDLAMGAVTAGRDPVETALQALDAGADVLLYRNAGEGEWAIFEHVVAALESGRLDRTAHEAALERIARVKGGLKPFQPNYAVLEKIFTPLAVQSVAGYIAPKGITVVAGDVALLPLDKDAPLWLVHPDRTSLPQYAADAATSPELMEWLLEEGFDYIVDCPYRLGEPAELPQVPEAPAPEMVVFVTINPRLDPNQAACYRQLCERFPNALRVLVHAGRPETDWPDADVQLALCSYRPPTLEALAERLGNG